MPQPPQQQHLQPQQQQEQPPPPPPAPRPFPEHHNRSRQVLEELVSALERCPLSAPEQRKLPDLRKRLENLWSCLREGTLSPAGDQELLALVEALASRNWNQALAHQVRLVQNDWNLNTMWIPGLKAAIKLAQKYLR